MSGLKTIVVYVVGPFIMLGSSREASCFRTSSFAYNPSTGRPRQDLGHPGPQVPLSPV